jgi:hypothetical protein
MMVPVLAAAVAEVAVKVGKAELVALVAVVHLPYT